jgi:hypothetical protein
MAGNSLRHFKPREIKINKEHATRILKFLFPDQPVNLGSLTDDDAGFAQALLVEAVDASTEMGYVHVLFDKAYMKPPTDFSFIKDIASSVCKQGVRTWFRHATGKDLSEPKIYEAVRRTIARDNRSVWVIPLQTGELTY